MKKVNKVKVSAPGKLLLFGEHAVVYGKPCIVTAVNKRIEVTIEKTLDSHISIEAPHVNVNGYKKHIDNVHKEESIKEVRFVEQSIREFFKKYNLNTGIKITTKSDFSSNYGLGSSSAIVVCTLFALSNIFNIKINKKELFDLAYQVVLSVQKTGSGFDIASAIYGGTIYFVKGGKVIKPIKVKSIPLVVGYTGVKADTPTLINKVKQLKDKDNKRFERIFNNIEKIVNKARVEIEDNNWNKVGELMNQNQEYLRQLNISSDKLERLIDASLKGGAYGAKLSGAGGGDCMISVVSENNKKKVEAEIGKSGGEVVPVISNQEGVRIEV